MAIKVYDPSQLPFKSLPGDSREKAYCPKPLSLTPSDIQRDFANGKGVLAYYDCGHALDRDPKEAHKDLVAKLSELGNKVVLIQNGTADALPDIVDLVISAEGRTVDEKGSRSNDEDFMSNVRHEKPINKPIIRIYQLYGNDVTVYMLHRRMQGPPTEFTHNSDAFDTAEMHTPQDICPLLAGLLKDEDDEVVIV